MANENEDSNFQKQQEIFLAAVELKSPEERAAYLEKACGGDTALRASLESLVKNYDAGGGGITGRAGGDADVAGDGEQGGTMSEELGTMIGRYKLLEKIGEGGYGTVYMAEQTEPVVRKVALKLIKLGMDTKEVIARFEAERQALAMMDDPNIAKVLDAGSTESGRPYFVMELVDGIPITRFCDERDLGTRQRLDIFLDVCSAVQHAHQKGVIHRDIKPSNVLVTLHGEKPVPKVIDFGIAKATRHELTDKTLFTQFGQVMGTPVYMSPEQATLSGLDIDTRSDIYALGVLLYELISGLPPFDAKSLLSAGYDEMRRIIREEVPPKPSTRLTEQKSGGAAAETQFRNQKTKISNDLDWIVMKAIEKDRSRRYDTANAMAADIGHFLSDEPVSAAAPSAGYKFRKFARRNKAALGVVSLIALVLLVATGVSIGMAVRAITAEKAATKAGQLASERLDDAEAVSRYFTDIFRSTEATEDGREVTVAATLDRATEQIEIDLADQPERKARLQATLGRTYYFLGLPEEANPLLESVRDFWLKTHGPDALETLDATSRLALSYGESGRNEEALALQEATLKISPGIRGSEHRDTMLERLNLANFYAAAGRKQEALALREEVLKQCQKILGEEDRQTLMAMTNLALSYRDAGREEEALEMEQRTVAVSNNVLGARDPGTLLARCHHAKGLYESGRIDDAMAIWKEILPVCESALGAEHRESMETMHNLAVAHEKKEQWDEAVALRLRLGPLLGSTKGEEHPDTVKNLSRIAESYFVLRRIDDAVAIQEQVLETSRRILKPEDPVLHDELRIMASCYRASGRWNAVLKPLAELRELSEKFNGPDHAITIKTLKDLGYAYFRAQRFDDAVAAQKVVVEQSIQAKGEDHADTNASRVKLAHSHLQARQAGEAVRIFTDVVKSRKDAAGDKHPLTIEALGSLGLAYDANGQTERAIEMLEIVRDYTEEILEPDDPDRLGAMTNLAGLYYRSGDREKAIKLQEEAVAQKRKHMNRSHPFYLTAIQALASYYQGERRNLEAKKLQEEAVELSEANSGPGSGDHIQAMNALASSHANLGDLDKAIALQTKVLALSKKEFLSNDPRLHIVMRMLAGYHDMAGNPELAKETREELARIAPLNGQEEAE